MHLEKELLYRGFLKQVSDEKVFALYNDGGKTFYYGMDPTANSLHLGNFVGFMHAVQYMKRGNKAIFLIGGATGMIGDPGGKESERTFLDKAALEHNVDAITKQVHTILDNLKELSGYDFDIEVVNNLDFYKNLDYITFLREVGKYITVNQMMKKETIKRRLTEKDKSISYTEFSYMLMQAYDFYKLFTVNNCRLQIAGSDQRGNLVTGIELIRKKTDKEAYGITTNLILDASGKKFGKSEGNALWLDPHKNNPLVIYQYFMNTDDTDVERFLKLFTLLSLEEITNIVLTHQKDTSQRFGQQQLAYYVTQTIFGEQAAKHAEDITSFLFTVPDNQKKEVLQKMDIATRDALHQATGGAHIDNKNMRFLDLCVLTGLTASKGEAKQLIKNGALFLFDKKITDIGYILREEDWVNDVILIKKGKKTWGGGKLSIG